MHIVKATTTHHPARARTFIIESQLLFAKALAHVLSGESSIEVIGDSRTPDQAVLSASRPDLIIIDIDTCDLDIREFVLAARSVLPSIRMCALSIHLSVEVMQRCLGAGVDAYMVKDMTPAAFLNAIKSVVAGDSYCDPRVAGRLLQRRSFQQGKDISELSMRETEVVRLIVGGLSNKEIGSSLQLSEKTIKNHVSRIFSKFNCCARTQAAVHAIRSGIA